MKLTVEHLSVSLNKQEILHDISVSAGSGEFVGIIGPNGSGKTTFLKALRGLYPLTNGTVTLNDKVLAHERDKDIARHVAYMQQSINLNFGYTAKEIVLTARYPYLKWWQNETVDDEKIVEAAMKDLGIWHLKDRAVNELSGGERQRVFLAKALAQETELLLLDEPTAALDLVYADEIFRRGQEYCKAGKTIFIVVHDLELAAKYCTRLLLISEGHLIADGTPKAVLTAENLQKAFHLASAVYEDPYFKQQRIFVFPNEATDVTPYRRGAELPDDMTIMLNK